MVGVSDVCGRFVGFGRRMRLGLAVRRAVFGTTPTPTLRTPAPPFAFIHYINNNNKKNIPSSFLAHSF